MPREVITIVVISRGVHVALCSEACTMSKNSGLDPHKTKRSADGTVDTISEENHMQRYVRLANTGNMHGTPGQRKGKS